ncbi:MAG: flippase [Armatimonadetes bacterium]|nr:flippase [Armatimonadota bacterium]
MSTARSMARSAGAMMLSQLVTWSATFALILYLPRTLGAGEYGKLQFVLALVGMFSAVADFGMAILVTREVARDRERAPAIVANALALQAITGVLALAALLAAVLLMRRPPDVLRLGLILGGGMLLFSAAAFMDSVLRGLERVPLQACGLVITKVLETAAILALLFHGGRAPGVAWAMVSAGAVHLAWSGGWVLRLARPRWGLLSVARMSKLVEAALPFFLFAVFYQIYDQVDLAMLAVMTSDTVVGWYAAAYRLFDALFFLPHIFNTVAFPVLSRLSTGDLTGSYAAAVRRAFAVLCAAAVAVSVSTLLLADPVVDLLYTRKAYPGSAAALRVLALALGCMYVNTIFVMVLQTTDRQTRWMRAGALAALANPGINLLLIPPLGHLGAAISTVVTEAMLMALAIRACPPGIWRRADTRVLVRCGLAGCLLAGAMAAGLKLGGPLLAVALGMPVYAAALLRLGVIRREEIALLRSALASRLGADREGPRLV